jgi:hypothetical protein
MFKINLHSNDSLLPSTSDKNTSKYTQWVYDRSGACKPLCKSEISRYSSRYSLLLPKYIWLLESKQIIQGVYDWILTNYDFVASRVDGILYL